MENNQWHKSVATSVLYNVAMKGFHNRHAFIFELLMFFKCGEIVQVDYKCSPPPGYLVFFLSEINTFEVDTLLNINM